MPADLLFYDGGCALCHGAVRFCLKRDRLGRIRYAPLGGPTFEERLTPSQRTGLPDSLVVLSAHGDLLVKSAAVLHLLHAIGGMWRPLAWLAAWLPLAARDALYDAVARSRHRWFRKPDTMCPVIPREWQVRFDP